MNKQNMVYSYNAVLFSNKNKWNTDACYNMVEPWKYSKMPIHKRPYMVWFHYMKCPK